MGVSSSLDILSNCSDLRGTVLFCSVFGSKFTAVLLFLYFFLPFYSIFVHYFAFYLDNLTIGDIDAQSESELEGEALSDSKPTGSMEREDDSMKQSKLGDGNQSDTKQSSSLESDNALLKHSSLEAGQPTANKSSSDLVPSKHNIPFKQKGEHFTGKHAQSSF
jgi:hypothetical protein